MSQAKFQKRQREKARREKAAAKLARKEERRSGAAEEEEAAPMTEADQARILAQLAELHERFEAGTIEFADFAEAKDELTARLDIR